MFISCEFNTVVTQVWCPISTKYSFMFLHSIFTITSVKVVQTSDFHRTCPPRVAKLSVNSSWISINFIQVCCPDISEWVSKGRESVTPTVLGVRNYIIIQTSDFIAFLVVTKVTTAHLIIEFSRSFDRPIYTRVAERPALAWSLLIIISILLLLILFLCTLSP